MSEGFNSEDLNNKFAEIAEILQNLKQENASRLEDTNRIVNNLCENVNKDEVVSKISNLETIIARVAGDYDVSLNEIHENIMAYLAVIKDDCESADIKINNFAFEINALRNEFDTISAEIKKLYGTQSDNFNSVCNGIYTRFDSIMNTVSDINVQQKTFFELKDEFIKMQNLVKELIVAFAKNDNAPHIISTPVESFETTENNLSQLTKDFSSNLAKLKDQLNFVSSDLMENIYNYYDKLSKQFEPVKDAILKFANIDFDKICSDLKEQIAAVSVQNESTNLNEELLNKLESVLKESVSDSANKILSVLNTIKNTIPQDENNENEVSNTITKTSCDIDDLTSLLESKILNLNENLDQKFDNIHKHLDEAVIPKFTDVENKQNEILDKLSELGGKGCEQKFDNVVVNEEVKAEINNALTEIRNTVKDQQKFLNTVNILEAIATLEDINNLKGIEQLSKLSNIISVEKLNALNKLTLLENLKNLDRINELENIPKLSGMIELQNELKEYIENLDKKIDSVSTTSNDVSILFEKVKYLFSHNFKNQIGNIENKIGETETTIDSVENRINSVEDKINIVEDKLDTVGNNFRQDLFAVKTAVMKHVLNVFEQLSFTVEGEEIKDFVDEKTQSVLELSQYIYEKAGAIYDTVSKHNDVAQEIKTIKHAIDSVHPLEYKDIEQDLKNISDIHNFVSSVVNEKFSELSEYIHSQLEKMEYQFNQIRVGTDSDDGSYTYSMQDIESDIAHLRLALNNIKTVVEENSLQEITKYVNEIVQQVESLKFNITQDDIFKIKVDVEKTSADVISLSSRINKLLLASDESAAAFSTAMDSFKQLTTDMYEGIKKLDYTEVKQTLEQIQNLNENINKQSIDTVDSVAKLSLWANDVDEKFLDISDSLDKLKKSMPSNESVLDELETKFAKQQQRIEALEDKLDELLSFASDNESSNLAKKLSDIEKQMTRLNRSIERLTSYVDEE